jgi:hypothetical protein
MHVYNSNNKFCDLGIIAKDFRRLVMTIVISGAKQATGDGMAASCYNFLPEVIAGWVARMTLDSNCV